MRRCQMDKQHDISPKDKAKYLSLLDDLRDNYDSSMFGASEWLQKKGLSKSLADSILNEWYGTFVEDDPMY